MMPEPSAFAVEVLLLKGELMEYSTVIPTMEGCTLLATPIPVSDKLERDTRLLFSERILLIGLETLVVVYDWVLAPNISTKRLRTDGTYKQEPRTTTVPSNPLNMKVSDLVKELNLTVFCGEENLDTVIKGGYTSDLLSDVMGHMEEGMLWITMQTHQNIVAVSTLKDAAAVLIVNGASPDEETLQKGKDEDIPLLGTSLSAFVISGKVYQLLQNG